MCLLDASWRGAGKVYYLFGNGILPFWEWYITLVGIVIYLSGQPTQGCRTAGGFVQICSRAPALFQLRIGSLSHSQRGMSLQKNTNKR